MHTLMFVVKDYEVGESMEQVDNDVEELLNNEGFVNQGFFSSGYCDWFQVGGRWSTIILEFKTWGKSVWSQAKEMLGIEGEVPYSDPRFKDVGKTVDKLISVLSAEKPPASAILTEKLLESFKKENPDVEVFMYTAKDGMEMIKMEDVPYVCADKTTITIVDYHT